MRTLTTHRWKLEYIWQTVCHHLLKWKIRTAHGRGIPPPGGQTPSRTGQVLPTDVHADVQGGGVYNGPEREQLKCPSAAEWIIRHPRADGKDRQGGTSHSHPTAGTAPRRGRCLQRSLPLAPLEKSLLARKLPYGVRCQGGIQPGVGAPGRPGVPATRCFLTEVAAPGFSTVTTHCPQMCVVWSAGGLSVLCWSKSSLGFFRNMQETRTNFWANPTAYMCVFPGGAGGEEPACQGRRGRDASSACGPGGSPGGGTGNPLQCSGWRIPGTEEPGGVQPMGLRRVGHD